MSETFTAYLISVTFLVALALLIPCVESLAGLLHRSLRKRNTRVPQPAASRKSHIA